MITKEQFEKAFDERFPIDMKEKLYNSKVAIAGLGGLGSNIAIMLTRSGVGNLLLVDFDIVDITNLNRQAYSVKHIGKPKTQALMQILLEINPYINICTINEKVTAQNVIDIFEGYDYICEAFDVPEYKAMLVNELLIKNNNSIIISGNGMAGFDDANNIKTEKKLNRLYMCGDMNTDVDQGIGLMAPRVSICAGHQANKVIQLICERK